MTGVRASLVGSAVHAQQRLTRGVCRVCCSSWLLGFTALLICSAKVWGEETQAVPLLEQEQEQASQPVEPVVAPDTQEDALELARLKKDRFQELKAGLKELSDLLDPPAPQPMVPKLMPSVDGKTSPDEKPANQSGSSVPPGIPEAAPSKPADSDSLEPGKMPPGGGEESPLEKPDQAAPPPAPRKIPRPVPMFPFPTDEISSEDIMSRPRYLDAFVKPKETPAVLSELAEDEPVKGPIDRFALANSLFGTNQLEDCLRVLKELDVQQLTREEQLWSLYIQAGCHRKNGRIDEARMLYRSVLADPQAAWIRELAQWWLANLDSKQKLLGDLERLNGTLAAWEKEIDSLRAE